MNRQGKTCDAVEERMQSASKAFGKDIMTYKSKDVPWRINVNAWWTTCTPSSPLEVKHGHGHSRHRKKTKGWETKNNDEIIPTEMTDEKWLEYHTRTCGKVRKIWRQMNLPFLYEKMAGSFWRAMGWVCDEQTNTMIDSLKRVH